MRMQVFLAMALTLAAAPALSADRLCPVPAPLPPEQDDFRMTEDEITAQKYAEALEYFRTELPRQLRSIPSGRDVNGIEGFWIGYSNNLQLIEGYTLKTRALLERARSDGKGGGSEVARFCTWLKKQEHLD